MLFLISDTFTDSLTRLTGDEQKAVKTTVFDLQINPANPGAQCHKLENAKDKNFWSARVSADIRIIFHRTAGSLLLCYADHHDKAYEWAERRKIETHPKTGAAQLVEIQEKVREVVVPVYKQAAAKPVLWHVAEEELLGYGVPKDWVASLKAADEDGILELATRLPAEAGEAVLALATGGKPREVAVVTQGTNPFEHPDAQRRFRVLSNHEELTRALDYPWDKWTVFLHPEQKQGVERTYKGPARVSGSAGTGKTIVALHRAVFLARKNPDSRVLLTTFSELLANALKVKLRRLISGEPRLGERIDVLSLPEVGERLHRAHFGPSGLLCPSKLDTIIRDAAAAVPKHRFSRTFLRSEWEQVVDARQLTTWDDYRVAPRLGRQNSLSVQQRQALWPIFEKANASLSQAGLVSEARRFMEIAGKLSDGTKPPYDYCVIDEAQDLGIPHLRFLAALSKGRPEALFFAGDSGQRIFRRPFSWSSLGVDIRGRSQTLRVNYRTSHQIRRQADRLLAPTIVDADENTERRDDTVSVFNGPEPEVRTCKTEADESVTVAGWIKSRIGEGVRAEEIGVFVRSEDQLDRANAAISNAGLKLCTLDARVDATPNQVAVCTMHLAKGLEFKAVVVMACDDEVLPLQSRIESVSEKADLDEVYATERQLLYVACTRARDHLLVTGVAPTSEFLDDLIG